MQRKQAGSLSCPRCDPRELLTWSSIPESLAIDSAYSGGYICNGCNKSSHSPRWWCRKCNWDSCPECEPSLLLEAVRLGSEEHVRRALEEGANPNQIAKTITPLHLAVALGHASIVAMLLAHRASVMEADDQGTLRPLVLSLTRPAGEPPTTALVECAQRESRAASGLCIVSAKHGKLIPSAQPVCGGEREPQLTVLERCKRPAAWACRSGCNDSCLCVECHAQLYGQRSAHEEVPAMRVGLHQLVDLRGDRSTLLSLLPASILQEVLAVYCYPVARTLAVATALLQQQQTSLSAKDRRGHTLLHHLSSSQDDLSALAAWLLTRCPDLLPARDDEGNSALHLAVRAPDNAPMIRLLLARGADFVELNGAGASALSLAMGTPKQDLWRLFLDAPRFDPNSRITAQGETPLHCAVRGVCQELVKQLVALGARVDATDSGGNTPLHGLRGEDSLLPALSNAPALRGALETVNAQGLAPLHVCCSQGGGAYVVYWVAEHAPRALTALTADANRRTPLHLALLASNTAAATALLNSDRSALRVADAAGHTPPYYAAKEGNLAALRLMLRAGAALGEADPSGEVPLLVLFAHLRAADAAAVFQDATLAELVHSVRAHTGNTVLHSAASVAAPSADFPYDQLVELCAAVVDLVNADGDAALHVALRHKHAAFARSLLEHSANARLANKAGETPLHLAARHLPGLVPALLAARVDVGALTATGESPLDFAAHSIVAGQLLSHTDFKIDPLSRTAQRVLALALKEGNKSVSERLMALGTPLSGEALLLKGVVSMLGAPATAEFRCTEWCTQLNQRVMVCGAGAALGDWDPYHGVALTKGAGGAWSALVPLLPGRHEFKFALLTSLARDALCSFCERPMVWVADGHWLVCGVCDEVLGVSGAVGSWRCLAHSDIVCSNCCPPNPPSAPDDVLAKRHWHPLRPGQAHGSCDICHSHIPGDDGLSCSVCTLNVCPQCAQLPTAPEAAVVWSAGANLAVDVVAPPGPTLSAGAVNAADPANGETPLFGAVRKAALGAVRALLSAGAAVDQRNKAGNTPLFVLVLSRDSEATRLDIAELLLKAGADPCADCSDGWTPLIAAESPDMVKLLMRHGAVGRPDFRTLHMAVIQGRRALVTHLLKADPALAREPTAVKVLARRARSAFACAMLDLLAEHGVEVDAPARDSRPLALAVLQGGTAFVRRLLALGADPNPPDGDHPLVVAATKGADMLRLLLDTGRVPVNVPSPRSGWTALLQAVTNSDAGAARGAIRLLLQRGADVALTTPAGETVLHKAAATGENLLRALLDEAQPRLLRPLVNARDVYGRTALRLVCERSGAEESIALLLGLGADVRLADLRGWQPLHAACASGNAVDSLLAHGAAPDARGWLLATPLHLCAAADNLRAANRLLIAGADVHARDDLGRTPLMYAAAHCSVTCLALLWNAQLRAEDTDNMRARGTGPWLRPGTALEAAVRASKSKAAAWLLSAARLRLDSVNEALITALPPTATGVIDTHDGTRVVVQRCNVLPNDPARLREVSLLRAIRHPNVTRLLALRHDEGALAWATEAPLMSLSEWLRSSASTAPVGLKLRIAHDAALGVWFIHSCGLLHSNLLAPAAIQLFTSQDGLTAKIGDFALMQELPDWEDKRNRSSNTPLQLWCNSVLQTSCDVYDFGVRLFDIFAPPSAPRRKAASASPPLCQSCSAALQFGVRRKLGIAKAFSYTCGCGQTGNEAHWECVECCVSYCNTCLTPPSAWDLTLISPSTIAPLVAQCLHDDSALRPLMDVVLVELEQLGAEQFTGKALHQQLMLQLVSPLQREQLERGVCTSCDQGSGSGELHQFYWTCTSCEFQDCSVSRYCVPCFSRGCQVLEPRKHNYVLRFGQAHCLCLLHSRAALSRATADRAKMLPTRCCTGGGLHQCLQQQFACKTCKEQDQVLCKLCAEHCHKGHNVIPSGVDIFTCACDELEGKPCQVPFPEAKSLLCLLST